MERRNNADQAKRKFYLHLKCFFGLIDIAMKATTRTAIFALFFCLKMCAKDVTNSIDGSWGSVESGFQLSLHLEKTSFTNAEPIVAKIFLRNATNNEVMLRYFPRMPVGYDDGPVGFEITSVAGLVLTQKVYHISHIESESSPSYLNPGSQVEFVERVDKRFDLTNGTYTVQAVMGQRGNFGPLCCPAPKFGTNITSFSDATNHMDDIMNALMDAWRKSVEVKVESQKVKIKIE